MRLVPESPGLVREALRPVAPRPNVAAGLRAAVATVGPLLLLPLVRRPELLAWASLAGFGAVLADRGGLYRARARSMGAYTLLAALAALLGTLAAPHPLLAVVLTLVGVAACTFARVWGPEGMGVGLGVAVVLVFALASPAREGREALERAVALLGGGGWAMVLALGLWPVRQFQPARRAVGAALEQVAALAGALGRGGASAGEPGWLAGRNAAFLRAREAVEAGRGVLAALRRGRPGTSERGGAFVVALETGDQLLGALVVLEEALAHAPGGAPARALERLAAAFAEALAGVVEAVRAERRPPTRPAEAAPVLRRELARVEREHAQAASVEHAAWLAVTQLAARLTELGEELDGAVDVLHGYGPARGSVHAMAGAAGPSALGRVRENLSLRSVVLRHALRAALCVALTVWVTHRVGLGHGYWATITCLIILQPHGSATLARALQRVGGTLAGAVLAVGVAAFVHDPRVLLGVVFVLAAVSVAVLPINYGLYTVFLTPTFVLLAESSSGDWGLVWVRLAHTVLGAAVALAGARLVLRVPERALFPEQLAQALSATRALLEEAVRERGAARELEAARRRAGLALLNAEASFQRLLTGTRTSPVEHEALLTLLLYAHRLLSGVYALAFAAGRSGEAREALAGQAPALGARLDGLVAGLLAPGARAGEEAAPAPQEVAAPAPVRARLEQLSAQLAVLQDAAARWRDAQLPALR